MTDKAEGRLNGRLFLVGAGKMGGAMLQGWLEQGLSPEQVAIFDPVLSTDMTRFATEKGIEINPKMADLAPPQVLLLAVKPQIMDKVLPLYTDLVGPDTLVVSVAAGITIRNFETAFGAHRSIVRCIPNTPAAIGRGITALYPNKAVSDAQKAIAQTLLSAIGEVVWVEREADIDAVTGLSGSGPAYVFHMIEALTAAGEQQGLSAEIARQLARATVSGAGELIRQTGEDAATLRKNVTSPNGTTAAGLDILMNETDGLTRLIKRTVDAATKRSRELGS